MKKILLQIDACRNYGSTGRINEQIGLAAKKNGWVSYIAHGSRYVNPSELKSIQIVSKVEEYWHAIETKLFDNHGLASRIATKRFITKVQELNPTLIHLHTIHGYYVNYKILFDYLAKVNIPVVWTLHDCWNFTGHCGHFAFWNCYRWKSMCHDCPARHEYPSSMICDRSKKNYKLKRECFTSVKKMTLVPVSYWLEDLVKQSFYKDYSNVVIHTIHNGININIFKPAPFLTVQLLKEKLGVLGKKVLMGCAMPFTNRKGYYDFIKLRDLLDESYSIVMVGLSREQKREVDLKGIIGITRTQNVQELVDYYSMADLFLNLTYEDNFPTTNIEALACGTPVLTYDTGGSVEAVDEKTGIIVKKGNIEVLAKTIKDFTSIPPKKEVCRSRAVLLYNENERFQEYIDLYESILNKII